MQKMRGIIIAAVAIPYSVVPIIMNCFSFVYYISFLKLVWRNFDRVSRSRVFNRMIYVPDLEGI